MISKYFHPDNFKIQNQILVYLIVFFILLPVSNTYNLNDQDFKLFSSGVSKLVLLIIIVLFSITKNIQIALAISIFYIYVSIFNKYHYPELEITQKKNITA